MPMYNDDYNNQGIDKESIKGESASNLNWLYNLRSYSTSGLNAKIAHQLSKVSYLLKLSVLEINAEQEAN